MNTGWWEIDIHGCYSLVKISLAPICACKNNRRLWCHNASTSCLRDVTDHLWWRHNATSWYLVLGDNGEISNRLLFLTELCVQEMKWHVRNKIMHSLLWITMFFAHSWCDLPMIFFSDFVTRENHCLITVLVTKKIIIHGDSYIILYIIVNNVIARI